MEAIDIARICHEANRAYQLAIGEEPSPHWEAAPQWQKESALQGVQYRLDRPGAGIADQHDEWKRKRLARGWKLGPVKDETAKTHPNLVEYNDLPEAQRLKDALFMRIVSVFIKPRNPGVGSAASFASFAEYTQPHLTQGLGLPSAVADKVPPPLTETVRTVEHPAATREIPLVKRAEAPEVPDYRTHGKSIKKGKE